MRDYELVFIVHPQSGDKEELAAVIEDVKNLIETNGGVVQKTEPWGLRRLAYPINKIREGQYVLMHVGLEGSAIREIEQRLRLMEPVIRHLIVRLDED